MCAQLQLANLAVLFIVRPAPANSNPMLQNQQANVFDARVLFPEDTLPNPKKSQENVANLRQAADQIDGKVQNLVAQNQGHGPVTLFLQCDEGRSRSPRCLGAYLMRHQNQAAPAASAQLITAYGNRAAGCQQLLNSSSVDIWLAGVGAMM